MLGKSWQLYPKVFIQTFLLKLLCIDSIAYTQLIEYVNHISGDSMALVHTILTVLIEFPSSGYDISKRFEAGISCFWNASQQQIYRELGKMEQQGLVNRTNIPQAGKPDKKIYTITDAGKQKLIDWCFEITEPTPIREDLLVRIMAAPYMPKDVLIHEIQRRQQLHRQRLAQYDMKKEFFLEHGHFFEEEPSPRDKYRYLTLLRGIRYETSWVAWCDDALQLFAEE